MNTLLSWTDIKLGARMLIKHPALTIVGGLGMAVAVGINVGVFSFIVAYIYPTLPLEEGDRIVALANRDVAENVDERRSWHDFLIWRDQLKSVVDLSAFRTVERNLRVSQGPPTSVQAAEMTAAGFRVARVPPMLGRYVVEADERPEAPPIVVIGYSVWRNQFAGDRDIVGREVLLDRTPHTVVGVMPEGFAFPKNHRFWTTLRARPSEYRPREGPEIFIFGRLAGDVTTEEAQAELTVVGARATAAYPETHTQLRPMIGRYTHAVSGAEGIEFWEIVQLQLMVSLLLVVVALNVAVLIYARTAARRSEITVRTAIGASRGRIVSQLFTESFVLSVAAAIVGFGMAMFGIRRVRQIMEVQWSTAIPFWVDYSVPPSSVALTLALTIVAAMLTGVVPALQASGRRLQSDLRQHGGSGADTSARLGRTWTALVIAQIAVAVAVLPAAVNLGWNVIVDSATRPAYPAEEFVAADLSADADLAMGDREPDLREGNRAFGVQLFELMDRLRAHPSVASATFRTTLPGRTGRIRVEGLTPATRSGEPVAAIGVHPNFTHVFGARMLSGRSLRPEDASAAGNAVIVNDAFVRKVLRSGEVLGRRIRHVSAQERSGAEPTDARWYEIVGVSQDLMTNSMSADAVEPELYYPVAPAEVERASLSIRIRGAMPSNFGSSVREIAADLDPTLRLGIVRTLADSNRQERLAARLMGFTVVGLLVSVLLLSAAGIYAMMSFTVTQRRREIGIRAALGAPPREVLRSVFGRAAIQIASGVAVGITIAALLEWLTRGAVLDGRGGVLLPAFTVVMTVVALLSALGPARRGLKIDPTETLRAS